MGHGPSEDDLEHAPRAVRNMLLLFETRLAYVVLFVLLVIDVSIVAATGILDAYYLSSQINDCQAYVATCNPHRRLDGPLPDAGGVGELEASDGGGASLRFLGGGGSTQSTGNITCGSHPHFGNHEMHDAEKTLAYVSMAILALFLIEQLLRVVATRGGYLGNWLHVLDIVVITLSLALEILVTHLPLGGLLIVGRIWRFARTGYTTVETLHDMQKVRPALHSLGLDAIESLWGHLHEKRWHELARYRHMPTVKLEQDEAVLAVEIAKASPAFILNALALENERLRDSGHSCKSLETGGNCAKH